MTIDHANLIYLSVAFLWFIWGIFRKDIRRDAISIGIFTAVIVISGEGEILRKVAEYCLLGYYGVMIGTEFYTRKKKKK